MKVLLTKEQTKAHTNETTKERNNQKQNNNYVTNKKGTKKTRNKIRTKQRRSNETNERRNKQGTNCYLCIGVGHLCGSIRTLARTSNYRHHLIITHHQAENTILLNIFLTFLSRFRVNDKKNLIFYPFLIIIQVFLATYLATIFA